MDFTTKYMGLSLKNPIVAASSGLTDSVENIIELEKNGAAAVVLKSIFEEEIVAEMQQNMQKMSASGFIYPETMDFYEDHGDQESTAKFIKLIADAKKAVNIPVIASINCVTSQEWTHFPRQVELAGADALELNLFILPTDLNRSATENEKIYFEILEEVKKQINIPISLKISPYFSNLAATIQQLAQKGADGIVLFNRFYNPDIDIDTMEVTSGHILSSPEDLALSLRWIAIMANRVDVSLAASHGVHDGKALVKQLLAGADVAQIASAVYKNGPQVIVQMLAFLENWMKEKGYDSIQQFRGKLSQAETQNPAAYERVQFMKYFRNYK